MNQTQTRRAHQKSRTGCIECKRRRIKCGEEKPRCSRCLRHDKPCVYLPQAQRATSARPSPAVCSPGRSDSSPCVAATGTGSPSISPPPNLAPGDAQVTGSLFTLQDLELLHHWIMVTSLSIVRAPKLDYVWQTVLPQVAFRHDYVMHTILSLTALHIAYLNPTNRSSSMLAAAQHHEKSLAGFREDMDRIGPDNCDALFANAALTFFYAFLTFGKLYDDYGGDASRTARTSRILGADWIPLVRGIEAVLHHVYDHVSAGPLKSMLSLGNWDELDPEANADAQDEQIVRIRETWNGKENAEVYDETLYLLRKCRFWIAQFEVLQIEPEPEWGYNRGWAGPFIWLCLAPKEYFLLLEQRQPPALLIFACFGALLHSLDRYWWMEGCGKSIVSVVDECLGPYWSPWTEWPRQTVKPS